MVPAKDSPCRHLVEKIIVLLTEGITADKAVCSFIETTFSNPSLGGLKSILADETDEERDSLIDLLLFPDEMFQMALEPLLVKYDFSPSDQQWVIRHLSMTRLTVTIYFPLYKGHAVLDLIPSTAGELVRRLNICWQADQSLQQVIDNRIVPARRIAIYVRLRNANPTLDPPGIRLLCRFLEMFDETQADFFNYFDFMVGFTERINGGDSYQRLMKEKHHYAAAVQSAMKFEQMLALSNMETLMLQGIRMPTIGAQEATRQIDMIDRIALVLYGRTESLRPACRTIGWGPRP